MILPFPQLPTATHWCPPPPPHPPTCLVILITSPCIWQNLVPFFVTSGWQNYTRELKKNSRGRRCWQALKIFWRNPCGFFSMYLLWLHRLFLFSLKFNCLQCVFLNKKINDNCWNIDNVLQKLVTFCFEFLQGNTGSPGARGRDGNKGARVSGQRTENVLDPML